MAKHAFQIAPDQDHESQIGDGVEIHVTDCTARQRYKQRIKIGDRKSEGDRHIHGEVAATQAA